MKSRRDLLRTTAGMAVAASAASSQSFLPAIPNVGVKADTGPARSESGVGALLPWADALWAVTYNSHMERTGTGLGLYRIDDGLDIERVHIHNGTHANRFVHKESDQAFIGPYAIDLRGNFKFIPEFKNHRLTAVMRHLKDPAGKVYVLSMEGAFFELDVDTLKPRLLFDLVKDLQITKKAHFKGGCMAQGRVVVANNGFYEYGDTSAGLFEWDGSRWKTVINKPHMDCAAREDMQSNLFCTGWDERSVLFSSLVNGDWQHYRLPKGSHAFEHAWQTEWMRIREVETEHYLMDITGHFYELQPMVFENRVRGLKPICNHLRIIPDYCAFGGLLALGGNQNTPNNDNNHLGGQPQAGIWFGKTDDLWSWGKPQGWGGVWRDTPVKAGEASDPYLMTGFDKKVLHLKVREAGNVAFRIEIDFLGNGEWSPYEVVRASGGYEYHLFPEGFSAHWVRLVPESACVATAEFIYT